MKRQHKELHDDRQCGDVEATRATRRSDAHTSNEQRDAHRAPAPLSVASQEQRWQPTPEKEMIGEKRMKGR